ncbi:NADPH-dependent FMN reductase [Alkalithermobacter thermoalcaliphilus JW-YL-7 = DSM 7308]|uniref:NADPH-dependent FMN reductase n=1 Tax=Alkalithermobacter thermoalcaliphilus JW-YL-7 = DSM 7308 TaxID=1121328 RepID=A0A150FRJ4_CLOPD|nr:NADPH-dependent FMN reductase [[Clostridium] paradoxum JW-YL-7 = DSM 7308]SHK41381.1 NADPH-dependent FMN reductase [[Clostridium] paradoxum JW-YL-7 = DSM 7308]
MNDLYLIMPGKPSNFLEKMVENATLTANYYLINNSFDIPDLKGKKIIFAVELDDCGFNIELFEIFSTLYKRGLDCLERSSAIMLIKSNSSLYTKSAAKNIAFLANQLGCSFKGHPLVEATSDLSNFKTWQKTLDMSLEEICFYLCKELGKSFLIDSPLTIKNPKILAIHSSSYKTSNTLLLWNMVKKHLTDCFVDEFYVENGTIVDCKGCSFKTCKMYSNQNKCFYEGTVVEDLFPAIENSDYIVWLCPNYNDAISAKLMAVINRLTVLYKKMNFYDKLLFSIIVSGNSGSDCVAKQLIGGLNINKGFRLPPYFCLMETANDPKSILDVSKIEEKALLFAKNILKNKV